MGEVESLSSWLWGATEILPVHLIQKDSFEIDCDRVKLQLGKSEKVYTIRLLML